MRTGTAAAVVVLAVASQLAVAQPGYEWRWPKEHPLWTTPTTKCLTENNGAHAVAMREYQANETYSIWTCVVINHEDRERPFACELTDIDPAVVAETSLIGNAPSPENVCVALNSSFKNAIWASFEQDRTRAACTTLTAVTHADTWATNQWLTAANRENPNLHSAVTQFSSGLVCAVYPDVNPADEVGLVAKVSGNNGRTWSEPQIVSAYTSVAAYECPSLAVDDGSYDVYALFCVSPDEGNDEVIFKKSTDAGFTWDGARVLSYYGSYPCIAAISDTVFACWVDADDRIAYKWSTDAGANWSSEQIVELNPAYDYAAPNVSAVLTEGRFSVAVVCEVKAREAERAVASSFGRFYSGESRFYWKRFGWLCPSGPFDGYNPSVATINLSVGHRNGLPHGTCVWADPRAAGGTAVGLYRRIGYWRRVAVSPSVIPGRAHWGLEPGLGGQLYWAGTVGKHVASGPVLGRPIPVMVAPGGDPALAIDGNGVSWIVYVCDDTLWCVVGDSQPVAIFCGSSAARPEMPSIHVYPDDVSGQYVGAVAFPVYDSVGETSMILWAKFDAENLLLDTIASVDNLGDSCPSINIAYGDSVCVVWQRGDSVVSAKLLDYGPGNWNRPTAWSALELVTANGYHPASRLEGNVLHCAFSQRVVTQGAADTFNVCRATCDLSPTAMFQDWISGANPSNGATGTTVKANSVYAGCGVTVWQEQVAGVWNIYARVRDSVVTLVANDTDAYHPHAVACSSAVSPSIDQIRVNLLYTSAQVFEVDSGVYDTGEVRFQVDSFNVSNAGPGATRANNGTKLVRKPDSDSLFAVYADAAGGVYFAWSASGDSWRRLSLCENGEYPALSYDGTGRLWVVYHDAGAHKVMARFRAGDTWSTAKALYSVEPGKDRLSGISLSGSPDNANSCAYVAFRYTNSGNSTYLVVAKFNADNLKADTLAEGEVDNPCIAAENSGGSGDRLHAAWEDNGNVRYSMTASDWATDDWQTFPSWEEPVILFESGQQAARHPCLVGNSDKLVLACAEGSTPDIYVRERATIDDYDDWEEAVNLSNTLNNGSEYPVVFLGDSVLVAWEEHRNEEDYDILACVNYGDTVNLADNSTRTSFPHVLLQPTSSPEPTVILHLIASENPKTEYYEVSYSKLDLADILGGQQSASTTPARIQPELFPAQPNPFNRATTIRYQTGSAGRVLLRVFDASGRVVRTLDNSTRKPGRYTAVWDGTDTRGRRVANGIYFYGLDTPDYRNVKKAVLMR